MIGTATCEVCERALAAKYCARCELHMCGACGGEHVHKENPMAIRPEIQTKLFDIRSHDGGPQQMTLVRAGDVVAAVEHWRKVTGQLHPAAVAQVDRYSAFIDDDGEVYGL